MLYLHILSIQSKCIYHSCCIHSLCVSQVVLVTTQSSGSQPKVIIVTPAHHTGQHLIKNYPECLCQLKVTLALRS